VVADTQFHGMRDQLSGIPRHDPRKKSGHEKARIHRSGLS
jgi:hypothetical protein